MGRQAAREGSGWEREHRAQLTTRGGAGWEGGRALAHPLTHSLTQHAPVSTYARGLKETEMSPESGPVW